MLVDRKIMLLLTLVLGIILIQRWPVWGDSTEVVLASSRTTTGRDSATNKNRLLHPWTQIAVRVSITGGTATVKVQCSLEPTPAVAGDWEELASLTGTGLVETTVPCAHIATEVTAISGATVNSRFFAVER